MIHSSLSTRHSSLISLVIPVFNGGENFQRCLDAVRACDPSPHEVIAVDDGSTDESPRLAREHGAKVLTTDRPRSGPAMARNIGARAATGDVVLFVDADVAVQPEVIDRIAHNFEADPDLAACFGSYDEHPAAQNFLSQYKNLFHHYVHQSAQADASTFWAGCGAIRRDLFLKVGGFSETYPRPSIEDIELGCRLKATGSKLQLDKEIQCQHLKRWTWRSLLRSDILDRGVPWTELILRAGAFVNDLNLQTHNRVSVVMVYLLLLSLAIGVVQPTGWLASAGLAIILLLLNWKLYRFFKARRGLRFALRVIPTHWLYYFYNGISFSIGAARHVFKSDQSSPPRDRWAMRAMIGVVLIGAAFRLVNLGRDSFWYDELLQVNIAGHDVSTILSKLFENAAMPLDYFITHVMLIFGRSEFWLRFPAAMWGLLTLPIVYQIGRRLFDRSVGVLAAALLAIIGVHTFFSQELRPYALLTFLAVLSFYFLIQIFRTRRTRYWIAYSVTIALAVLTHYFMLFLIGAQGLIVLIGWLHDRLLRSDQSIEKMVILKFAGALIPTIVVLMLTPWFGSILDVGRLFVESVLAPNAIPQDAYLGQMRGDAAPIDWTFFQDKVLTNFTAGGPILPYAFFIMWIIGAWTGLRRARRSTVLLIVWSIVPAALVIAFLRHRGTFFAIRYILYTLPAFIILIALSLNSGLRALYRSHPAQLQTKLRRVMQFAAWIGLIVLAGHFANASITYLSGHHEHWREAGQFLIDNVQPGDLLVLPQAGELIEFYAPTLTVTPARSNVAEDLPTPAPDQRMWLVLNIYNYPPGMYEAWASSRPHIEYRFDAAVQVMLLRQAPTKADLLAAAIDVQVPEISTIWATLAGQNEVADNIDAALDQVQHALDLTRDHDQTLALTLQRADILRRAQRLDLAAAAYQHAIELDAGSLDGWVGLGRVYVQQGKIDQARAQFMQALTIDPQAYAANLFLAQIYQRAGDADRAATYFAVAADMHPELITPP